MISQQTLKGNLVLQDYTTAFTLNQGDKGVPFKVELLENGTPYILQSTDIVTIEWLKPNGNPFLQEGNIKYATNYIEFTTPESVAQYSGSGSFNIIISNSDVRKGTIRREYKVVPTSMKPGSVSEDTITDAITELRELSVEIADLVQNNQDLINNNQAATKQDIANVNSSLEEKVDNIQIGTRNYLLNTGLKDNTSSFVELAGEVTRVTTMKTPNGNNCFYTKLSNKTNKVWRGATQEVTSGFSIGDTMTFSVWTYVTSEVATDEGLFVEAVGLASDNSTRTFTQKKQVNASDVDKWVKYELTFVIPANTVKLQCLSYVVKNGSWYTGDYKLEKGNKATDWSPNLKDIDNAISTAIVNNNTTINNAILESKKSLYPVGSLYFNATKEANPSQLLGFGTWERIAQGKTLIGVDTGDTDFNAAEKTGGSKTHTLTVQELAPHTHAQVITNGVGGGINGRADYVEEGNSLNAYPQGANTDSTGGGQAFSIMQPYITVYIWKRTA